MKTGEYWNFRELSSQLPENYENYKTKQVNTVKKIKAKIKDFWNSVFYFIFSHPGAWPKKKKKSIIRNK